LEGKVYRYKLSIYYRRSEIIMAEGSSLTAIPIVLVHGGFVDCSGWESVYKILKQDGYRVAIVQNPTISLAEALSSC
jgi:hypothetical protein